MNEQLQNGSTATTIADAAKPEVAREPASSGEAAAPAPPPWLQPLQLTIEQAAILTSYSVRTLKRLVAAGEIPGVTRCGRCLRFNRRAVEKWLEDGCPKPGRRVSRR